MPCPAQCYLYSERCWGWQLTSLNNTIEFLGPKLIEKNWLRALELEHSAMRQEYAQRVQVEQSAARMDRMAVLQAEQEMLRREQEMLHRQRGAATSSYQQVGLYAVACCSDVSACRSDECVCRSQEKLQLVDPLEGFPVHKQAAGTEDSPAHNPFRDMLPQPNSKSELLAFPAPLSQPLSQPRASPSMSAQHQSGAPPAQAQESLQKDVVLHGLPDKEDLVRGLWDLLDCHSAGWLSVEALQQLSP